MTWLARCLPSSPTRWLGAGSGLPAPRVLIDAGLDLGKTAVQSVTLLRASGTLAGLGYPVLLSASNKRFLGDLLGLEINERRDATTAAHALGISLGCRVVRAHDVPGHAGYGTRWPPSWRRYERAEWWRSCNGPGTDPTGVRRETSGRQRLKAARDGPEERLAGHRGRPGTDGSGGRRAGERAGGGAERSLVLEDSSAEELDVAAVAAACQTPPFLADRRVVVLREAGRFNADQLQPLLSYLAEPLATTKLVVVGGGGTLPARFINAFKALPGTAVVSTDVTGREVHSWVNERIARARSNWRRERRRRSKNTSAKTSADWGPCSPPWKPPTGRAPRWAKRSSSLISASPVRYRPGPHRRH